MEFHRAHLTEHLWPRSEKEFRELAEDECLLEVVELKAPQFLQWLVGRHCEELVGLVYVKTATEPNSSVERAEFGGIFVVESCRGFGLAGALGIVSISNYFVLNNPPPGRMIAHVHEFNEKPRRVLENQLGFHKVGEEIPPDEVAPKSMKRNERGQVVGHLFEFDRARLAKFADWIETFDGITRGKEGEAALEVTLPAVTKNREQTTEALRDLSGVGPVALRAK